MQRLNNPQAILALDVDSLDEAKRLTDTLYPKIKIFKIGSYLFTSYGPKVVELGADVVAMLHPDGQYPPEKLKEVILPVVEGKCDMVLGSRFLEHKALQGGMPLYKFISNRFLTITENICLGLHLSEYHTGYRAFARELLVHIPLFENSNDFVFDNQTIAQAAYFGYQISEVSTPSLYTTESSSVPFFGSVVYGLGVLITSMQYCLQKWHLAKFRIFDSQGRKIDNSVHI
jgi:glycosyltransferase involved in cell wall biosynthesis